MIQPPPPPPPPPVVEELVVTVRRLPPSAAETAFSEVVLDAERLEARVRLDEALTETPGVSLFRRNSSLAANPTTQGLSLRAFAPSGAGRALVTLDGVPQNDPFGGWVIWSALPSEGISQARIVRGAGAGPYGAGALTGVVALSSREGDEDVAEAFAAERGGARGAVSAGVADGALRLTAAGERSDGYTPVRGAAAGAADTPLSLATWTAAAQLSRPLLTPLGDARLEAQVQAFEERRGSGLQGADSRARGAAGSVTLSAAPTTGRDGFRLQGWLRESDLLNRSVAVAAGRAATTPANSQDATPALGWGLNAAWRRAGPAWTLEAGADLRVQSGETQERFRVMGGAFTRGRVAGGRTDVAGVYGEATRTAGPWLLTANLRGDRWSASDARRLERDLATGASTLDVRPADRDGVLPTGRLGLRRAVGEGGFMRAAAYAGFRPPTLNELHRPFRVGNDLTEANAALEPERLYGVDAAVGLETAAARLSVGLFYNRLVDAVTNVTVAAGPFTDSVAGFVPAGGVLRQRRNAGAIEAVGLETEAEADLTPTLSLRAAAAYVAAEVDGGDQAPQLTGKRPAQTPRATVTAGARWTALPRLTLSGSVRYESGRFEDDLNSRRLSPGVELAAEAAWRVREGAELFVAAENLLDAEVETGETADGVESFGPPRLLRLGLRWRG